MRTLVHPSRIDGTLKAPPSKSVMLRAAAAALLAGPEPATLLNPTLCEDAKSALRVVETLGATVDAAPDRVTIVGGLDPRDRVLDCGESGLCLRMFTAIAALWHEEITLTGRGGLLRRPATTVECPSAMLGATCETRDGLPPIRVRGPLKGGEAVVDGAVSSQFLSGLLLALPLVERDSRLRVRNLTSRPYVDLTLELLRRFGVEVWNEDHRRFTIPGGQRISVGEIEIEGDWSAAAFLLVLGALGGRVRVTGLEPESHQADRAVLDVLGAAGAHVVRHPDGAEVERSRLRAFTFDVTDCPDLLPPLAALACRCEGTTVIRGVGRLRHKESDRTAAVARELEHLGIHVTCGADAMEIRGGRLDGGRAMSHGDHRIAMALATAAVSAGGPIAIEGSEHVAKSYPRFFEDLMAAGGEVR